MTEAAKTEASKSVYVNARRGAKGLSNLRGRAELHVNNMSMLSMSLNLTARRNLQAKEACHAQNERR